MFEVDVKNMTKGREGGGPARVWGSDSPMSLIFYELQF